MKKSGLFLFIVAMLFFTVVTLSWCTHAGATTTVAELEICEGDECQRVLSWTTTTGAATVPTYTIGGTGPYGNINGVIANVTTDPGATAPTDNYTVTLLDPTFGSEDILGAACSANCDTANTETRQPLIGGNPTWRLHIGVLQLSVSGNLINNALGKVIIRYFKAR